SDNRRSATKLLSLFFPAPQCVGQEPGYQLSLESGRTDRRRKLLQPQKRPAVFPGLRIIAATAIRPCDRIEPQLRWNRWAQTIELCGVKSGKSSPLPIAEYDHKCATEHAHVRSVRGERCLFPRGRGAGQR